MLYLAFAGQAAVWAGLYFLLDKLSKRWEGKAFFTLVQTNALWKGMVACFVLIFPLLLLGFFVGWTHLRINNWLWIAFYSGALLVLSCRRWWVRLLGVGLNLLSLWALTLIGVDGFRAGMAGVAVAFYFTVFAGHDFIN